MLEFTKGVYSSLDVFRGMQNQWYPKKHDTAMTKSLGAPKPSPFIMLEKTNESIVTQRLRR